MDKIVECVPNFSEGQDPKVLEAIAGAIRETKGCRLLDVDAGASTNRTVYTFVGSPETVVEGALAAARVAHVHIDMRNHQGTHPRFGAMDVCPIIPVSGVTMAECAEIARKFAQQASAELDIPFYLYEEAATLEHRRNLSDLRQGEYEALPRRLKDPLWKPDYGPCEFRPKWGITATGARMFLIAYNVNIIGTPNQAHRIALNLREAGRGPDKPGRLQEVKGMGWFVKEYNLAQVTVNLTNYHTTPVHVLYEEAREEARLLNLAVAGSEIVGVVPKETLLMAAQYYIDKDNLFIYEEDQKIRLAVDRLGLNSVSPFRPKERIIEYIIAEEPDEPLAAMSVRSFIEETAARSSAPGGGSASAAIAALGVGLGSMVAKLTHGIRRFEHVQPAMQKIIPDLHKLTGELISMIDADTNAFNEYMEGVRMPKDTAKEQRARHKKMQAGLKTATSIPLTTMRLGDKGWHGLMEVARHGNIASRSDIQVGAKAMETGIWGAYQNVLINLEEIEDLKFVEKTQEEAGQLLQKAEGKFTEIMVILDST